MYEELRQIWKELTAPGAPFAVTEVEVQGIPLRAYAGAPPSLREVWLGSANRLSLPWLGPTMERTLATMGPDYWRYGFAANRQELAAICRYSRAQHLAAREVTPEEMFHPSVLES